MVQLWFVRIKYGLSELSDVPERYYDDVLSLLVQEGLYDEEGNRL